VPGLGLLVLVLRQKLTPLDKLTRGEARRELLHDADEGMLSFDPISPLKPHLGADLPDTRAGILAWEQRFAETVSGWLDNEAAHAADISTAIEYAAWATLSPAGQQSHRKGLLFKVPHRLDMQHLVPVDDRLEGAV